MAEAANHQLTEGLSIRAVKAPYFLATKLEAIRCRGNSDFTFSHDLEDLLFVIDERDALPSYLVPDASSQSRVGIVLRRASTLAD